MQKVLYSLLIVVLISSAVSASMAKKWEYFIEEGTNEPMAQLINRAGDRLIVLIRKKPTNIIFAMAFVPHFKRGERLSPLRPLVKLDGNIIEMQHESRRELGNNGTTYVWSMFVNAPLAGRIRQAKVFDIQYLVFLNAERFSTFYLKGIGKVVAELMRYQIEETQKR